MNGSASCAEAAPLAAAAAREGGERPLPDNFPVGMRVLLVDDDVTCLAVVKRMLLSCKYEVTTCSQATKALSLLRENKSAFDIILSDVHMPDMDGFRLLELIGLDMDLPVIMMSADTRVNIVMKGIKHGACDFLIKPVQIAELQNIWQHLVRRKYHDNREHEHSANVDGSDRGKQIDDSENGTEAVDGSDCSWMYQKKNTDIKEEEDSELDNTDPSSSKKPRLVWTVELHQQFVNAVHQLGIEKAVPKRILELMNIPGLTRENVASHLQKFRNYLKRLSGVVQHHEGLSKSLYGGSANAKAGHLGSTGFQTLAVTGQIPPETLASLQDQLLGRPHSLPVSANAIDHTILHQSFGQYNKSFSVEQGTSFGQPLLRGQGASFPLWSSNNHGLTVSTSHDTNILATMLKQQQSHPVLSESQRKVNVHPCRLFSPSPLSQSFHVQNGSAFSNQVSLISPSQRSSSFHVENSVHPINQNSVVVASQVSTSLQTGNSSRFLNQNSIMVPSQSLSSVSEGNNPVFLRQNMPSQPFTNFQTGINQFDGLNSMINSFQTSSPCQSKYNVAPVTHNPILSDNISIADYNQLSSEFNIVPSNVGQVLDEGFNNSALINSYSNLGSVSSIDGNSRQKIQSADENFSHPNASIYDVPNSCNVQTVNRISDNLSDENNVRSPIFVGNGNHLPRGFVVDETGTHSNDITNGNIHITDDAYLLNQDLSGLNGSFQHGPPATTSFK